MKCFTNHLSLLAATLLFAAIGCQANFKIGDFVPTSRKAQFHGQRTQWHDILGSHVPKFGLNRMVVLPLPRPKEFSSSDDYKLQLSFDGDRVITHWVQIAGRQAPPAPFLLVELVRSGDALVAASAKVEALPPNDLHYARVEKEFADPALWPKHLPVFYSWKARHEVDEERGLIVLFGAGAVAMLVAVLGVLRSYQRQLRQFVDDVTGEVPFGGVGGGGGGPMYAKAD